MRAGALVDSLAGMIRRVPTGLSAFVVGAPALAGCTQPADQEPSPTPSVSAPTPAPSPTPTMPEEDRLLAMIPDAAKGDDLPAAIETARFFLSLQPKLFQGDDPALVRFLSMDDCGFCESEIERALNYIADVGIQAGGDLQFSGQPPLAIFDFERDDTTTALVAFEFTELPLTIVGADG